MSKSAWTPPAVHSTYHELRQTLEARATAANIDANQVETVHRRWRSLGKKAANGRLK
jgi:hypothetical protein